MRNQKYTVDIFKVLLLFLFIGFNGSLTLFYHAHSINGQIIFHSHPYKSNKTSSVPYPSHKHSPVDFIHIQQLNESLWEATTNIPSISTFTCFVPEYVFSDFDADYKTGNQIVLCLRAPPVLSSHS